MSTFGKTTTGSGTSQSSGAKSVASSASPASDGTLTAGHAYVWAAAAGKVAKMAIYADNAGAPGALLALSDEVALGTTAEAVADFPFSGAQQIPITSGATYWVAITWPTPSLTNGITWRRDGTSGIVRQNSSYGADPYTPSGTTLSGPIAGWAEYTEAPSAPSVKVRGAAGVAAAQGTNCVVTRPAGVLGGDLMLVAHVSDKDGSLGAMTAPAGWDLLDSITVASRLFLKLWGKVAAGTVGAATTEPSSYTFPDSTSADASAGLVAVYDHDASNPFAAQLSAQDTTLTLTSHPAPSVTGVNRGLLITVHAGGHNATNAARTYTPPVGMTEQVDTNGSVSGWVCLEMNTQALTADGATGSKSATVSAACAYATYSIVIAPSGSSVALGRTGETDQGRALTAGKATQIGRAGAADGARSLTAAKAAALGRATETDWTRALGQQRSRALGRTGETDGARALGATRTAALGRAGETDAARPLGSSRTQQLGRAGETSGTRPVLETRGLSRAGEHGLTRSLLPGKTFTLGRAGESDRTRPVGPVTEVSFGRTGEIGRTRALAGAAKDAQFGQAVETDGAGPVGFSRLHPVGRAAELDGARPVMFTRAQQLGRAADTSGARALVATKWAAVSRVPEADRVRTIGVARTYQLGRAGDSSGARPLLAAQTATDQLNPSLWAVDPDSGELTPLPHHVKLSISPVRNSPSQIAVEYPVYGRNFDRLAAGVEQDRDLEVEIWLYGSRTSARRGLLSETSGDDVQEQATWTFSGTLLPQLLDEVLVEPQAANDKRELVFAAKTAGEIAATVLQQAQTRGALVGVGRDFTTAADSAGAAWPDVATMSLAPGTTLLELLGQLVDLGMIDGFDLPKSRVLRMWAPGGQGADRTVGPAPTILRGGRSITEAPRRHSVRKSGTAVLVAGKDGIYGWASNPSAQARRGRRIEVSGSAQQMGDESSVTAYAQNYLQTVAPGQLEVTHAIVFGPGHPRPVASFDLGDWVWSDTRGHLERLRVQQWSLIIEGDVPRGEIVLGTALADQLQALARKIKRLASGTQVVGTSNPPNAGEDLTPPAAPTGLVASSIAYQDTATGETLARIDLGWLAVTTNAPPVLGPKAQAAQAILDRIETGAPILADWTWTGAPAVVPDHHQELLTEYQGGTTRDPLDLPQVRTWLQQYIHDAEQAAGVGGAADDVAGYRVRYAYVGLNQVGGLPSSDPYLDENTLAFYTATPEEGVTGTAWSWGGVGPGREVRLQAAAFDRSGNQSVWSDPLTITTAIDNLPPAVPSRPTGEPWFGTARLTWDGNTVDGIPMLTASVDFDHAELHLSPANDTSQDPATTFQADLYAAGTWNVTDLAYGVGVFAWLVAVDTAGNRSAPSATVGPITPEKLVQIDIGPNAIARQQIIDGEIVNAKIANLAVNDAKIADLAVGKLTTGTLFANVTLSGQIRTALSGARAEMDGAGLRLYNTAGSNTVNLKASDGSALVTGTYKSALDGTGERINILPDGTLRFYPSAGTNFSQMANFGNDVVWRGPLDGNSRSGRFNVNTLGCGMNFSAESEIPNNLRAEIAVTDRLIRTTAPVIITRVNGKLSSPSGKRRFTLVTTDGSGNDIGASVLDYTARSSDSRPALSGTSSGIVWGSDGIAITTADTGTFGGLGCDVLNYSTLHQTSSAELKDIDGDARGVLDMLEVVRKARAQAYTYTYDKATETPRFGPLVEELPPELQIRSTLPDGTVSLGIDLSRQVGVLWGAVGQICDQQIRSVAGRASVPVGTYLAGAELELAIRWDEAPLEVPTGGVCQVSAAIAWLGRTTARIKPGSLTASGCTVIVRAISPVVPSVAQPVVVEAQALYLWTPPYQQK